jgi:Integrase core domain
MAVIFPRPWYASVPVWASTRMSVIPAILHHPQQNAFVERYHRTYQQECLALDRPTSLEQARQVTEAFTQHYNVERPNQALSCGNQPPHTAFPSLPNLPPLPQLVDPDHWLHALDGLHLERKVNRHGQVSVDLKLYYVSSRLAGQRVVLHLDATHRCLHVLQEEQPLKSLPLKGLLGQLLTFEQFLALMLQQARAQQRLRSLQERRFRRGLADSP